MSNRRDKVVKAIAGALQPKNLDLTQFARARSADPSALERQFKVRSEDAAGALAYATKERVIKGKLEPGDRLPGLLLQLKYAKKMSRETFNQAHLILLERHGGLGRHLSLMVWAIGAAAIFEWINDACPKCRGRSRGAQQVQPCLDCGQTRVAKTINGQDLPRPVVVGQPSPGCPKCKGMGRIFTMREEHQRVRCGACNNSGRLAYRRKQRYTLVNDYLFHARGRGIVMQGFFDHWLPCYWNFLDVLQRVDRDIALGIDLGFNPDDNRPTGPERYAADTSVAPATAEPGDEELPANSETRTGDFAPHHFKKARP